MTEPRPHNIYVNLPQLATIVSALESRTRVYNPERFKQTVAVKVNTKHGVVAICANAGGYCGEMRITHHAVGACLVQGAEVALHLEECVKLVLIEFLRETDFDLKELSKEGSTLLRLVDERGLVVTAGNPLSLNGKNPFEMALIWLAGQQGRIKEEGRQEFARLLRNQVGVMA